MGIHPVAGLQEILEKIVAELVVIVPDFSVQCLGLGKQMNEPEPHRLEKSEPLIQVLAELQRREHIPLDVEFAVEVRPPERQLVERFGQDAVGMKHQAKPGVALSESKGFPGGEPDFALGAAGLQRPTEESRRSTGLLGWWKGSGFG